MPSLTTNKPSTLWLTLAFAAVYIVWGSTYFFIKMAVQGFPPMLLGSARFFIAGMLLLGWNYLKGERLWEKRDMVTSAITGLLLLFVATGIIIWVERSLPSVIVAIMVSANPIWFVVLDKANWKINLSSRTTLLGLVLGFAGVLLLFGEAMTTSLTGGVDHRQFLSIILLAGAPLAWVSGSIFSKRRGSRLSAGVSTSWQMIIAGLAFLPASFLHHEVIHFHFSSVPLQSWLAIAYLILFGSIGAFSAYVWLLKVRPATQVSTHSYVNPVVAVVLGVCFAHESVSLMQVAGLAVILTSVLLVNLSKYRVSHQSTCPLPKLAIKAA